MAEKRGEGAASAEGMSMSMLAVAPSPSPAASSNGHGGGGTRPGARHAPREAQDPGSSPSAGVDRRDGIAGKDDRGGGVAERPNGKNASGVEEVCRCRVFRSQKPFSGGGFTCVGAGLALI